MPKKIAASTGCTSVALLGAEMRLNVKDVHGIVSHEPVGVHHGSDPNTVKAHALKDVD